MSPSSLSVLSENARESVAFARECIREALQGDEYASTTVATVRGDALKRVLSLAAPRVRALAAAQGTDVDGVRTLSLGSPDGRTYEIALGTGRSGTGGDVPNLILTMHGPAGQDRPRRLMEARFFADGTDRPWSAASARIDQEVSILEALDTIRGHLESWDGILLPSAMTQFSAEIEMVEADGGFPGALCREHLETLRRDMVVGTMAWMARLVPDLAATQAKAGYAWGSGYLAYDDTDKRSCSVPVAGASVCLHENVDLIDDNSGWLVAVVPATGGPGRISIWGFSRHGDGPTTLVEDALSHGLCSLPPCHVSLDLTSGSLRVMEGFDPTVLVGNAFNGVERDVEAYANLRKTLRGVGARKGTDFATFARIDEADEEDAEADGPSP